MAVALVVLVLAGLFLKSFRNSLVAKPGFDHDRVMLGHVDLAGRGYTQERAAFCWINSCESWRPHREWSALRRPRLFRSTFAESTPA